MAARQEYKGFGRGGGRVQDAAALERDQFVGRAVAEKLGQTVKRGRRGRGIIGDGQDAVDGNIRIPAAGHIGGRGKRALHHEGGGGTVADIAPQTSRDTRNYTVRLLVEKDWSEPRRITSAPRIWAAWITEGLGSSSVPSFS